jgi:hypothetical protein
MSDPADPRRDATDATKAANRRMAASLPFEGRRDFDEAARGFIAPLPDGGVIRGADGAVWDLSRFSSWITADAEAPETVNPSLWRQMQLTVQGGLYEVVHGLYQVRTADLSNITFAEGHEGIVVFDPLISTETAAAALEPYYAHRPRKPVVGGRPFARPRRSLRRRPRDRRRDPVAPGAGGWIRRRPAPGRRGRTPPPRSPSTGPAPRRPGGGPGGPWRRSGGGRGAGPRSPGGCTWPARPRG